MEMLNMGKKSWFRIYSCNSKGRSILCSLSLVYIKAPLLKLGYKLTGEQ